MKVVTPITITAANYALYPDPNGNGYHNGTSFLDENDYGFYNAATAYVVGNRVNFDALQSVFECTANTTGTAPTMAMTTPWIRVSAMNAWKVFDGSLNDQTLSAFQTGVGGWTSIFIQPYALGRFDTVCLLNIDCDSVFVSFHDQDGITTYSQTKQTVDTTLVVDAWTYCFAECPQARNLVFDGIDGWGSNTGAFLSIILTRGSSNSPCKVGEIVIGASHDLGKCHAEPTKRLVDYSRKQADAFGNLVIVERAYSYQLSFDVEVLSTRKGIVEQLITDLRATPAVYFSTSDDVPLGVVSYGYPTSFEITYATPDRTFISIEIEGLT